MSAGLVSLSSGTDLPLLQLKRPTTCDGERQRLTIPRALVTDPPNVMADEPPLGPSLSYVNIVLGKSPEFARGGRGKLAFVQVALADLIGSDSDA